MMMADNAPDAGALARILIDNPTLSWRGWWSRRHDNNEPPGTLERVRRESLDEFGLAQFRRAMAFLEAAPRTMSINRRHGTYGWKHCAERWTRSTNGGDHVDYYVGEGSFIAAAIASGMTLRRGDYGTYTNLSQHAWSMGGRR
jgi:hypothetical protein